MFRSPLDILTEAAGALAGLYLLFTSLPLLAIHSGVLRDHRAWAVSLSLLLISAGVLGIVRTWKSFFIATRLPSPPRLFKEDPGAKKLD